MVAAYAMVDDKSIEKNLRLRFIDNKAGTSTMMMSLFMPAKLLNSTKEGYTFTLECNASEEEPVASSQVNIVVISDVAGVKATLANTDIKREVKGEQELNLSKDTILMKYLLEPTKSDEVAAFGLIVNGCDRGLTMELLDKEHKRLQLATGVRHCKLPYCPISFKESGDNYTLLCTIKAPDADLMAAEAEKIKEEKKSLGEHDKGASIKCSYSLNVESLSSFGVSLDTRRQDSAIELKAKWESSAAGRAEKAKGARNNFLSPPDTSIFAGTVKDPAKGLRPVVLNAGLDQAVARQMSKEDKQARVEMHEKELTTYKEEHRIRKVSIHDEVNIWREETKPRAQLGLQTKFDKDLFWDGQFNRMDAFRKAKDPTYVPPMRPAPFMGTAAPAAGASIKKK